MTKVKVTCSRCAGTGRVANRTARYDARCFCCGGVGHYFRKPAPKRATAEEIAASAAAGAARWAEFTAFAENLGKQE